MLSRLAPATGPPPESTSSQNPALAGSPSTYTSSPTTRSTASSSPCESSPACTGSPAPLPGLPNRADLHSPALLRGCSESGRLKRRRSGAHDNDLGSARRSGSGLSGLSLVRVEEDLTPVFPPAQHNMVILDLRNRVALHVIADLDPDHVSRLTLAPVRSDRQHCRLFFSECHHADQLRFRGKLRRRFAFTFTFKSFIRILPALFAEKVSGSDIEKESDGRQSLGETGFPQLDLGSGWLNRFLISLEVPPAADQMLGYHDQGDQHQNIQEN